jgi:integrase
MKRTGQLVKKGPRKWLVRVFLGRDANGKRQYWSETFNGSKKDADDFLNRKLTEKSGGVLVSRSATTLDGYADAWLDGLGVRDRTREGYRAVLLRHVRPKLGPAVLRKITATDIRALYQGMAGDGYSPRTIRQVHEVLRNLLEQAVEDKLMPSNPAAGRAVRRAIPARVKVEHRVIQREEIAAFLEAAGKDRLAAYWTLLLFSGLRPQEALALRWRDLDGDRVHIRRVLVDAPHVKHGFADPKTAKSARAVVLPGVAVRALETHRKRQAVERLAAGPKWRDNDLMFGTLTGGPLRQSWTRPAFYAVLVDAKLPPMRIYDLRHSCATLLLAEGESAKVVQERLGHASITLTMDTYSHVLPSMQKGAASKLDKLAKG